MIGHLRKNSNGRFEIANELDKTELTSGSLVWLYSADKCSWSAGRVEHAYGIGYIFVPRDGPSVPLKPLMTASDTKVDRL